MKPTKNIAVIDVGSNTLRLLIGSLNNHKIQKIYSERVVTRLGNKVKKNGYISNNAIEISIKTLEKFKKTAELFNVFCIIAFGTNALRESVNGKEFCDLVKKSIGLNIHILSGQQEAYYTLYGIIDEIKKDEKLFIADIGGGSTEWILLKDEKINMGSLPIGVLKIKELFFNHNVSSDEAIFKAKDFIQQKITQNIPQTETSKIIVTGGTASTLAMIYLGETEYSPEKTHMIQIPIDKFKLIVEEIISTPLEQRKKIKGITPDRVDIICEGLIILERLVEYSSANTVVISEHGIIEGVMKNYDKFCYNSLL